MYITGPVLEKLNLESSKDVLFKINSIARSHQIQSLTFKWINQAYDNNIIKMMNKIDQNEFLETLFEYSSLNSQVGTNSLQLYNLITNENKLI